MKFETLKTQAAYLQKQMDIADAHGDDEHYEKCQREYELVVEALAPFERDDTLMEIVDDGHAV